ncbi:MAG: A/G-specific adenine glycosylase [Pirellulaceae bacterium]
MDDPSSDVALPAVCRRRLARRLLAWFSRHARDLPWRRTRDPYQVWISEVMLQQTQVATVIPYFERFVARWPDVLSLAAAEEQEVLRAWEGLGYYRRARQLHAAAGVIAEQHGGRFPDDPAAVRALPGIGRYTAGAILSIAFDQRQPILEANTQRVLSRLAAVRGDVASGPVQRRLWELAETLLPARRAGDFNQALMELGSEICTVRTPHCRDCPVQTECAAHNAGLVEQIPAAKKKLRYEEVQEAAVVVRKRGRVLVRRCPADERWAGLWDFPRFAVDALEGPPLDAELTRKTASLTGLTIEPLKRLATIKHGVTRFRITLFCHEAQCSGGRLRRAAGEMRWITPEGLSDLPLSVTGRKISRLLADS